VSHDSSHDNILVAWVACFVASFLDNERAALPDLEVGHAQFLTSRATQASLQPDKVRLGSYCFNRTDPKI